MLTSRSDHQDENMCNSSSLEISCFDPDFQQSQCSSSVNGEITEVFDRPSNCGIHEVKIRQSNENILTDRIGPYKKQARSPLCPIETETLLNSGKTTENNPTNQILSALKGCSIIEATVVFIEADNNDNDKTISIIKITCPLCLTEEIISNMITLSCNHRFCKEYFKNYTIHKINENQVTSDVLVCPTIINHSNKICNTSISIYEIKDNIPEDSFLKYERFITYSYCESENMCRCPKCNEWYIDISDILQYEKENTNTTSSNTTTPVKDDKLWKNITCGLCNHMFCGKCKQIPHVSQIDINLTCEQYFEWLQQNEHIDESFQEYVEEQKLFVRCTVHWNQDASSCTVIAKGSGSGSGRLKIMRNYPKTQCVTQEPAIDNICRNEIQQVLTLAFNFISGLCYKSSKVTDLKPSSWLLSWLSILCLLE
eukprot:gene2216-4305_t